ncbi:hypothetical protein [Streptomyces sp. NPDC014734]|uniref:hypothetical protein n=1 Tax=Streptomyces sp. NPDC014734 TaxID=3364886 RepID=UPI003700225A
MKKMVLSLRVIFSAVMCLAVVSGCSGGEKEESSTSQAFPKCHNFLGEKNVGSAVDALGGGGDLEVRAPRTPKVLLGDLAREANAWSKQEDDVYWNHSYTACSINVWKGKRVRKVESTVEWSVTPLNLMREPRYAATWREVNGQVLMETRESGAGTRLLFECGVPGAPSGQMRDMPLEIEVRDSGLDLVLRKKMLAEFARTLAVGLDCINSPQIPKVLPE